MNAPASITQEQWQRIESALEGMYGSVSLEIDGYPVTLVRLVAVRKCEIVIFVDGWMKGAWLLTDCEERRRFCRPVTLRLRSHARKQRILARVSKRSAARMIKEFGLDETSTYYTGTWGSFRALRRHLIANNKSLRLVSINGLGEPEPGAIKE